MMKSRKYNVGDVLNNRVIISINGRFVKVECLSCGRIRSDFPSELAKHNCICRKKDSGRFSGKAYSNSKEKIQAIKKKYANGVSNKIVEDFVNELFGM